MRTLESDIEINAPAAAVWRVVTDFAAYPEWNPFITRISGEVQPGRRLEVRFEPPGGRPVTFRPTVTAAPPDRELRWLGHLLFRGLFDGEHQLLITELDAGRVRFTQREVFRGLLVPLTGGMLDKTERGFRAMNQALKKRVED